MRLQGGIPSPGVKTSQGVVTTLTFRAIQPGNVSLVFTGNSQVLANDGRGTNILSLTVGATYRIDLPPPEGPAVASPTHPDQNAWYRSRSPSLQWVAEEGVNDFAFSLDQDAGGPVDLKQTRGLVPATSYIDLQDGLWYFHIRAKKGNIWGGSTTFLVRIDGTPPADFELEFAPGEVSSDRRPFVNFATTDALSALNRYDVRIVSTSGSSASQADATTSFFVTAQPPYRTPELTPGGYDVIVRAYDNAGNVTESIGHITIVAGAFAVLSVGLKIGPWFISWWLLTFFALGGAALGTWAWRHQHARHTRLRKKLNEDLDMMRERLRKDFSEVSERLAEEEHIKERLAQQLKRLDGDDHKRGSVLLGALAVGAALVVIMAVGHKTVLFAQEGPPLSQAVREDPLSQRAGGEVPIITTFRGQLGSDELLYLGGTAPSDAIVIVSFSQEQQEALVVETRADRDGRWSYLHPRFLQPGVYRVFARTRDDVGNLSDWGPQVTIEVVSRTISVGGVTVSFQAVVGIANVLLILIAAGLGGTSLWFNRRSHRLRDRLRKEVHEAEVAVQEGFRLLRRDIEKELQLVGTADFPSRKFSKEEKEQREKLVVDLQAIEERVRKEVEDIEQAL